MAVYRVDIDDSVASQSLYDSVYGSGMWATKDGTLANPYTLWDLVTDHGPSALNVNGSGHTYLIKGIAIETQGVGNYNWMSSVIVTFDMWGSNPWRWIRSSVGIGPTNDVQLQNSTLKNGILQCRKLAFLDAEYMYFSDNNVGGSNQGLDLSSSGYGFYGASINSCVFERTSSYYHNANTYSSNPVVLSKTIWLTSGVMVQKQFLHSNPNIVTVTDCKANAGGVLVNSSFATPQSFFFDPTPANILDGGGNDLSYVSSINPLPSNFSDPDKTAFNIEPGYGVGAPGGWAVPGPYIGNKDLNASINIADFRATVTLKELVSEKSLLEISYTGYASPDLTANMSVYEYSMDNGVTWSTMTKSYDTVITGLLFNARGLETFFKWEIKEDLGLDFYNTTVRIRLKFVSGEFESDYVNMAIYYERTSLQQQQSKAVGLPADYKGVPGDSLLDMAPKVQKQG